MLEHVVVSSFSVAEVMRKLGLKSIGGQSHKYIRNKIDEFNIDRSHFKRQYQQGAPTAKKHWSLRLVKSHKIQSNLIRQALIESGRPYECEKCELRGDWQGEPITIQVDHINGDTEDNRPNNLRFLCPNCHSQTDTHSKTKTITHKKCVCGKKSKFERCAECYKKDRRKSIPSTEELRELVWSKPSVDIARDYGVSDRTIGKWCTKRGITKPPPGYWMKTPKPGT